MNRRTLLLLGMAATIAAGCNDDVTEPSPGVPTEVEVPAGTTDVAADKAVLTALYEATNGPNWTRSEGWLTEAPLVDWHGVTTDEDGRVATLDLSDNELTGELPADLGNLASLLSLSLWGNDVTGKIPPELGNLASLEWLDLYDNDMTGEIPPELSNLASLATLSLWENDLTGEIPAELGDLASLQSLYLGSNGLTGEIPPELGDLANLLELGLSDNELTGEVPAELGDLASLQVLELHHNRLTGALPERLADLTNLQSMYWTSGYSGLCAPGTRKFMDFLEAIEYDGPFCHETDDAALVSLYNAVGGSSWSSSDGWLHRGPLSDWHGVETDSVGRVTVLDLSENGLSGDLPGVLWSLKALRELRIDGNSELGGRLVLGMTGLSLRTLRYEDTSVCAPDAPSFRSWLQSIASHMGNGVECPPQTDRDILATLYHSTGGPNWIDKDNWLTELPLADWYGVEEDDEGRVTALDLHYNALRGEIPPELGDLASLKQFIAWSNDLTGQIPPELGSLASLQTLYLSGNGLTGEIPPELGNLGNLDSLYLGYNSLTGEIPPELGNIASLQALGLSNNDLTGELPAELGGLASLQRLYLSSNDLTGEVPPELGNLASLQELILANNAGISGTLPAEWTSLHMTDLQLGGTGLCAPSDDAFQSWLRSIPRRRVPVCVERAEGEARAAAYVVQAVQSFAFPVPLVAGRPGLLRVFASAPEAGDARVPAARATFYQRDGLERTIEVPSGNGTLEADLQEGSLDASANVEVPGDVLRPGVEMVVEVDPAGALDPGLAVPTRIPATGRTALEVYELPPFDVTVVPFLWETEPDSSILDMTRGMTPDDSLFEATRMLLPVGAMSVTVHEPVWSSSNSAFDLLSETEAIRRLENGGGYWMGTSLDADGAAGVAFVPGQSQFSVLRPGVIAHEFGHSLYLFHAPCGGAGGPDPAFPNRSGRVGAWGWDRRSETLVPSRRRDLMSYCAPAWIGDYHFARAFRWRMHHEAGVAAFQGPPTRVLLVWGGTDADGQPFLNPSFVVDDARASLPDGAGEWRIVGEAEDGRALFDRSFEMKEMTDAGGRQSFVFALPAEASWADALARIVLTGPGGTAELDAESGPAAALLLDPSTGRVRGILRNWPSPAAAQADAAVRSAPEPGLEVQVSRGIPAPDAWRR